MEITPENVQQLIAMGFCRMSDCEIARISRRVDASQLDWQSHFAHYYEFTTAARSQPAKIEHAFRFDGEWVLIGDLAQEFPPSETTITHYIMLDDEERAFIKEITSTARNMLISSAAREQREREAYYLEQAIF